MITGYSRGHEIVFENNEWLWFDTKESITVERPCKKCGKMPTKEGYDACLGFIEDASAACCGHGITEKLIVY
jgi:hypothetical protein